MLVPWQELFPDLPQGDGHLLSVHEGSMSHIQCGAGVPI